MDRNALRVFGIIITSIITIAASLVFLLYSLCWTGPSLSDHDRSMLFLAGEAMLLVIAGLVVAALGRGLTAVLPRSQNEQPVEDSEPSKRSPAIDLTTLILVQFAITGLIAAYNFLRLDTTRTPDSSRILAALCSFLCYQGPYMLVLFTMEKKPSRTISALALATPSVLFLANLILLPLGINPNQPNAILRALAALPALVNLAICWPAWRTVRQRAAIPRPRELVPAVILLSIYFFYIHSATPWLYVIGWK